MTIDKIDPVFAESGGVDTDAVFDTWAGNGYVDERVRYKGLNKVLRRADESINEIIDNTPPAVPGDERESSVGLNVYATGSCFASMLDSANRIDTGGTTIVGAYPTTIDGVPKILAIDIQSDYEVIIIDPETMTVEDTIDLSAGLAVGGWHPLGVVADGTNAYFVFEGPSYARVIQAFNMSDWTVVTGWPATGTAMPDGSGFLHPISMCNADASFVAVLTNYYNIGTGAPTLLELYDKSDGTLADSGDGDSTPSGTLYPYGITSNGTYLFFRDGNGYLCSAAIANLATGCGWANGPLAVLGDDRLGSVACAGGFVITIGAGGVSPFVYVAHESNALISAITTDDDTIIKQIYSVAFDGISFWALGIADVGGTDRSFLFRLRVERCLNEDGSTAQAISGALGIAEPFGVAIDGDCGTTTPLISDGRDLWFPAGGSDFDECVFRFPLTHWR